MKDKRPYIEFKMSFFDVCEGLSDDQIGRVMLALHRYLFEDFEPKFSGDNASKCYEAFDYALMDGHVRRVNP